MHTLKIFWEMGNLTFSAMCVVVFVLLYSNITLGKASRTARTALFSFSLLIHIAFFAVSYIMYGNVAVLMLNDLRILFNIFSWGSYLVYYLAAYRNHPVSRRLFHFLINCVSMSFCDVLSVLLFSVFDAITGYHTAVLLMADERWEKWYCFFGYIGTITFYLIFLHFLKKFVHRRKMRTLMEQITQKLPYLVFPAAQAAIVLTLTFIIQKYRIMSNSPIILLLVAITFCLGVVSNVMLFHFIRNMQEKEQIAQKLQFYEQYEALSLQYQEQAGRVSHEAAKMRHDFNNQMQVFSGLIAANELEDAKQFAAELHSKFQDQALRLHYCENKIANVILQQTAEQCAAQNIRFEVQCSLADDLPIQKIDLCSLFLHPLQNAMQAVQKLPEEQRCISCNVQQDKGSVCIQVQCFAENESDLTDRHNVLEKIAREYHGTAEISCTGNEYTISVQVFLPENEEASCSTKA